jgi:hypothetical protein
MKTTMDVLVTFLPKPVPFESIIKPEVDDSKVLFRGPLPDRRGEQILKTSL